jgi:hypothetical protein
VVQGKLVKQFVPSIPLSWTGINCLAQMNDEIVATNTQQAFAVFTVDGKSVRTFTNDECSFIMSIMVLDSRIFVLDFCIIIVISSNGDSMAKFSNFTSNIDFPSAIASHGQELFVLNSFRINYQMRRISVLNIHTGDFVREFPPLTIPVSDHLNYSIATYDIFLLVFDRCNIYVCMTDHPNRQ